MKYQCLTCVGKIGLLIYLLVRHLQLTTNMFSTLCSLTSPAFLVSFCSSCCVFDFCIIYHFQNRIESVYAKADLLTLLNNIGKFSTNFVV